MRNTRKWISLRPSQGAVLGQLGFLLFPVQSKSNRVRFLKCNVCAKIKCNKNGFEIGDKMGKQVNVSRRTVPL